MACNFSNKIVFSVAARFTLGGYDNNSENPQEERSLLPEKVTVWWCEGVIAEIPPNMCQKVAENYLKRINTCKTSREGHLNNVVFHT